MKEFYNINSEECTKIKRLLNDNFENLSFNNIITSDRLTSKVTEVAMTAICLP